MLDFTEMMRQGTMNPWLFIPSAILLGALHGLEPGHSKTMMAAFIVAIRGTIAQAVMLGLAATLSHTLIVWLIAMGGLYLGQNWSAETSEPYFQIVSAVLIIGVALWMLARAVREGRRADHHHDETHRVDTGHGLIAVLSVEEDGVPPRFRLAFEKQGRPVTPSPHETCSIETTRPDGTTQVFALVHKGVYLESDQMIPEPHEFTARLSMVHGSHSHDYDIAFTEHGHAHDGLSVGYGEYQDAHERAHASDIQKRFANRNVTTGQIIVFGLTGGLIPCPAAITVLLLCLQLKKIALGATLVLCFSIGLAVTMVVSGVLAALSVKYASGRWSGFGTFARRAPYFSSVLIILIGLYIGYHGVMTLLH